MESGAIDCDISECVVMNAHISQFDAVEKAIFGRWSSGLAIVICEDESQHFVFFIVCDISRKYQQHQQVNFYFGVDVSQTCRVPIREQRLWGHGAGEPKVWTKGILRDLA